MKRRSTPVKIFFASLLAMLAIGTLAARTASASPAFPDAVKATLGLSYSPPCSLCHDGGRTGSGTVTTPFGSALRAHGAVGGDTAALAAALKQMETEKVDSDGDGVTDIDELKNGTDPNSKGGASLNTPEIGYGCGGASVASRRLPDDGATLVFFAVGALLLARRRSARGVLPIAVVLSTFLGMFLGCYDVSYVGTDKCASGGKWTGHGGSELMDPGRACLECHAETNPRLTLAGTVYTKIDDPDDCMGTPQPVIIVTGADGKSVQMTTNEAGNFYTRLAIVTPYSAKIVMGGKQVAMVAQQTSGDCNSCHSQHGANGAAGRLLPP